MSYNNQVSSNSFTLAVSPAPSQKTSSTLSSSSTSFLKVLKAVAEKELQILSAVEKPVTTPAASSLRKEVKLKVPNLTQGNNECGPTSLAMIMKYYGIDPGNYHKMFSFDTIGHSPLALKEKASAKGLIVRQANKGSLQDLTMLIDMGIPLLVLGTYQGGSFSSLDDYFKNASRAHWVVVTGYKSDDYGKITHIYLNDPNYSTPQCWTVDKFLKFWENNLVPGGHRYFMAMVPKNISSWAFQEGALRRYLPQDRISKKFSYALKAVHELEEGFYTSEKAANSVARTAKSAWKEVCSWFS
jgi:uncharacterized protein YvpB